MHFMGQGLQLLRQCGANTHGVRRLNWHEEFGEAVTISIFQTPQACSSDLLDSESLWIPLIQ